MGSNLILIELLLKFYRGSVFLGKEERMFLRCVLLMAAMLFAACGESSEGTDPYAAPEASEDRQVLTSEELSTEIQNAISAAFIEDEDDVDPEDEDADDREDVNSRLNPLRRTNLSLDSLQPFIVIGSELSPVFGELGDLFSTVVIEDLTQYVLENFAGNMAAFRSFLALANGVLINTNALPQDLTSVVALLEEAFGQGIPAFFENDAVLDDFNAAWGQSTASQYAEEMASMLGIGVNSQVTMAIPDLTSEDPDAVTLFTLGVDGISEVDNPEEDEAEEEGTLLEGDEESSRLSMPNVRGLYSEVFRGGYPEESLPSHVYRSYTIKPWKKTYWKPDQDEWQDFRNNVHFKIQLTWDSATEKKYLRIFTLNKGGFDVPDRMLEDDVDARGYFMHEARLSIYPVNSSNEYSRPSWLNMCTSTDDNCLDPTTFIYTLNHAEDFNTTQVTRIYYSDDGELSQELERRTHQNLPGFGVYAYVNPPRWVFQERYACNADLRFHDTYLHLRNNDKSTVMCSREHQFELGGERKWFENTDDGTINEPWDVEIPGWFDDSVNERPHMPVYLARNGFTPLVQTVMWVDEDVTSKQRFIMRHRQYAKMAYRLFGKHYNHGRSKKYRNFTVDFSKVGPS